MLIVLILVVALAIFCIRLLSRIQELEQKVDAAFAEISQLRVTPPAVATDAIFNPPPPIAVIPPPSPPRPTIQEPEPQPDPAISEPFEPQPEPEGPTLAERLRNILGDEEWETIVGGSLLNKAGALILVIGIALFLGFSFGRITPAGRATIAFALSAGILAGGVWLEQRHRYRLFARGLIGAGWAALYATAYAAFAIPAARVIYDSFIGSLVLLAVAAGMVCHSLRYRAQVITAIAYFAAFAALAVSPSSPFAVISVVPLAASLLCLAAWFRWYSMALFGLFATYFTCISRGSSGAPLHETQTLFLVYWLMFEAFDLLRTKSGITAGGVQWIYPANLAGFLGLSYLTWAGHDPEHRWIAAAAASALFLADSAARACFRRPGTDLAENLKSGGYESSAFVSAVLAGLAIFGRVAGLWMSATLAVEAEILYLTGVALNAPFLRGLGTGAFAFSLSRLVWEQPAGRSNVLGHQMWNQTAPDLLHAAFFWLNRILRSSNLLMSFAAAGLVTAVIGAEAPSAYVALGWVVFGLILIEIGVRRKASEFRVQGYLVLAASTAIAFWPRTSAWAIAACLAAVYATALRIRNSAVAVAAPVALAGLLLWRIVPEAYIGLAWACLTLLILELGIRRLPPLLERFFIPTAVFSLAAIAATHAQHFVKFPEMAVWVSCFGAAIVAFICALRKRDDPQLRDAAIIVGVGGALCGLWLIVPDPFVTIAWTTLAVATLETGVRLRLTSILRIALLPFAFVFGRIFLFDLGNTPLQSVPIGVAGFYLACYRFRDSSLAAAISWLAVIPVLSLIYTEAGPHNAALGWMIVSLILLFAGTRTPSRAAELQSFLTALAAFSLAMVTGHWWISLATVAALYTAQFLSKASTESKAQIGFSAGATILLATVLYDRISGSLLTVSLGFEGLTLLAFGFALRERIFRLQGLAILVFCILKLFLFDLRSLETMYRILSFIALGLILLGVSWIYTRFREQLKKLL